MIKESECRLVRLGDECKFFSGGTPKSGIAKYYNGEIPFIRSGEIHENSTELFLSEEGLNNSSAKMVKKGDLLLALYGATSGEVDISKINGAINQAILCIRPHTINSEYLMYLFQCYKNDILNTYLQGGQGNLSAELIKNLTFDIPDNSTQESIVFFLNRIDKMLTDTAKTLAAIIRLKQGLIQKLFI